VGVGDPEPSIVEFLRDVERRRGRAECGELVAEVLVEGFEPVGDVDHRTAVRIQGDDAVVEVLRLVGFDERVGEVAVGGSSGWSILKPPPAFSRYPVTRTRPGK
jgi:hypothetical protein